jgi:hypothetical protein
MYSSAEAVLQRVGCTREQCLEITLEARDDRAQLRAMLNV